MAKQDVCTMNHLIELTNKCTIFVREPTQTLKLYSYQGRPKSVQSDLKLCLSAASYIMLQNITVYMTHESNS